MDGGQTPKAPPEGDPLDDWFDLRDPPPPPATPRAHEDSSRKVTPVVVQPVNPEAFAPEIRSTPSDSPDLWDWEIDPDAPPKAPARGGTLAYGGARDPSELDTSELDAGELLGNVPRPRASDPPELLFDEDGEFAEQPTLKPPDRSTPRAEREPANLSEWEPVAPTRTTPVVDVMEIDDQDLTGEESETPEFDPTNSPSRPPTAIGYALPAQQGDALSLVDRAGEAPYVPPDPRREMHERFELGDFTGALAMAEAMLEGAREDPDAEHVAEVCRTRLRAIYAGRLGALTQVPVMAVPQSELRWLSLDHRAGFVLSLIDGVSSLEEIMDVAAMPALEVLRTLYNLTTQRVIELRSRRR